MKIIQIMLGFALAQNAFALDSITILKPKGNARQEILQLICVNEQCQVSDADNERVLEKHELTAREAKELFTLGKKATQKKRNVQTQPAGIVKEPTLILEVDSRKSVLTQFNPEARTLEIRMRAALRKAAK